MKECLNCKKEFQEKKETAKYCSDSCRVMWNRKNGGKLKKEKFDTEARLQVLYNAVLDALGKINYAPTSPASYDGKLNDKYISDEAAMFPPKPKIRRSFANYVQLKASCENEDEWEVLKAEILASDLPISQKTTLTS